MIISVPNLWLGNEASYHALLQRRESFSLVKGMTEARTKALARTARQKVGLLANPNEELSEQDELAMELIEVYDNVGLIKIEGAMIPEESLWNSWMGVVGYPSISRALNVLLEDESITDIVMAYATPGGSAEGLGEVSDAIKAADRIKPVYAWSGSSMLSAGYWLGAAARRTYATKMASVGSVGAVVSFTSYARMRKQNGIDTTVVRSTPLKATPHPAEPLSDKGKALLQKDVDFLHGLFIDHIVGARPNLSSADSKNTWATGECFFGEEALQMGLVDAPLRTLDSLLTDLINAHTTQQQTLGGTNMPKRLVIHSEAARSAILAGIPGQISEEIDTEIQEGAAPVQASAEPQEPAVAELTQESPESTPEPVAATTEPVGTQLEAAPTELSLLLKETMAETKLLQEKLVRLQVEHETSVQHVLDLQNVLQVVRPALEKSIQRLEVGLGHRPSDVSGLSITALVGSYDQLYSELMKLPVGRSSLQAPEETDDSAAMSVISQRLTSIPGGRR